MTSSGIAKMNFADSAPSLGWFVFDTFVINSCVEAFATHLPTMQMNFINQLNSEGICNTSSSY